MNQLTFTTICKFRRRLFHTKRGIRSRPERSDGVKYQPENERPNRRSEIGAAQGVLTAWQISMSDDNAKLDRAEALAVIIAQAVRAMRDLGADNQQIIAALQIAVDEIAKSEGPK